MHVILICISVIIQLYSVLSVRRIIDITGLCTHHGSEDLYLTSGFGSFDGQTYIISTEKPIDCRLHIDIMDDNHVLTVVEIPDWHVQHKLCFQENITALTLIPEPDMLYCYTWTKALHISQGSPEFCIDPGLFKCRSQEVKCVFNRKVFCLSAEFICDGDDNCGVPNEYDEDFATCKAAQPGPESDQKSERIEHTHFQPGNDSNCQNSSRGFGVTYFMIFCSLIMCVLSFLLLALLFLSFSPKRKETFVYRFDNLIPLFDSETGVINYEIDIKVLFPPASKSLRSTKSILLNK